jgi:hypothetical protein
MHITAIIHSPKTELLLPPHRQWWRSGIVKVPYPQRCMPPPSFIPIAGRGFRRNLDKLAA